MNTPATFDSNTHADDLVLRFVGGKNDGESVSISTTCCTLEVTRQSADNEPVQDQCQIYRGPAGVAVQSHGEEVLINGEAKSVHWLKQGDRIQVSNSQAVEVVQLGRREGVSEAPELSAQETAEVASADSNSVFDAPSDQVAPVVDVPAAEAGTESTDSDNVPETVTETMDVAGDRIDFVSRAVAQGLSNERSSFSESSATQDTDAPVAEPTPDAWSESTVEEPAADQEPAANEEPAATEDSTSATVGETGQLSEQANQRFESLESSIGQLHDQAANVDRRFNRLEDSLNALTEHLERLAVGSLSSDSVESTPDESAALVAQYGQEVPVDVVSAPDSEAFAAPQEAPEVVETPVVSSAGDNYEKSISALFSELATTNEPTDGLAKAANEVPQASVAENLASIPVPSDVQAAEVEGPAAFTEKMMASMQDASPTLSSEEIAGAAGLENPQADGPIEAVPQASVTEDSASVQVSGDVQAAEVESPVAFTEKMMASMQDASPTLSSEEVAGVTGPAAPKADEPVEAAPAFDASPTTEAAPVEPRAGVTTESVADIFARLHAGNPATEGLGEAPSPEAPIRQTVQTTFEDIQASISAALDTEMPSMVEASVDNAVENQVVAAEPVETAEAVETVEPDEPEDDINSVMAKLRASLEAEDDEVEDTEESAEVEASETAGATDVPAGIRQKQDSVEDYMSMLMDRMNGDSADSSASEVSEATNVTPAEGGVLENKAIETLLTEEEFKPRAKATPIKSLDKMRELANSTSRSAVQRSEQAQQSEQRKSLILQALAFGSFLLAAVMIWAKSYIFGGAFFLIFFVTSAYYVYASMNPVGAQTTTSTKSTKKSASPEPTADSDEN